MSRKFEISTQKELAPLCLAIMKALNKGRIVTCEVKSKSSKTLSQLGYYYGVILPRVQDRFKEDGNEYSLEAINLFFNELFFFDEVAVGGQIIRRHRSKSGATVEEMAEFIDKVIRWCGDMGISIPEPQEFMEEFKNARK